MYGWYSVCFVWSVFCRESEREREGCECNLWIFTKTSNSLILTWLLYGISLSLCYIWHRNCRERERERGFNAIYGEGFHQNGQVFAAVAPMAFTPSQCYGPRNLLHLQPWQTNITHSLSLFICPLIFFFVFSETTELSKLILPNKKNSVNSFIIKNLN